MRLLSLIFSFPNPQSPLNLKRVRDKEAGELVLSDAAKNYHPGQGVYRSAYKNAMRMARTEINAAYLQAEIESYQSNPLVTGYEIKLSGNHTTTLPNGKVVHLEDICDRLAGEYPKTFRFTGWHPQCRCYIVPITIKDKEANKLIDDKGTITPDDTQGKQIDELPNNMQKWLDDNQPRIDTAKQLPPFIENNKTLIEENFGDLSKKIEQIKKQKDAHTYVAFEPISPIVIDKLNERRDLKDKLKLFDDIINDERATTINDTGTAKTVVFPNNKGHQHDTWKATKTMAKNINDAGESVAFLPELGKGKRADALILFMGKPVIADFKYCITTKANTLASDLGKGFLQANTIVLKLSKMDAGVFKDAIDYLIRNNLALGNIKLLNEYGEIVELTSKELKIGAHIKKIKGFL